ncbi:hypothetical protein D9M70_586830 [compost metagenome]
MPSICGSTTAQPSASVRRRDSRMPCTGVSRVSQQASASATTQPMPRLTSVVFLGSSSSVPPSLMWLMPTVPITVTSGIASAGMNSLLPRRVALAWYCSGVGSRCLPAPTPRSPAMTAMPIAPTPTSAGGSLSPIRKTSA